MRGGCLGGRQLLLRGLHLAPDLRQTAAIPLPALKAAQVCSGKACPCRQLQEQRLPVDVTCFKGDGGERNSTCVPVSQLRVLSLWDLGLPTCALTTRSRALRADISRSRCSFSRSATIASCAHVLNSPKLTTGFGRRRALGQTWNPNAADRLPTQGGHDLLKQEHHSALKPL